MYSLKFPLLFDESFDLLLEDFDLGNTVEITFSSVHAQKPHCRFIFFFFWSFFFVHLNIYKQLIFDEILELFSSENSYVYNNTKSSNYHQLSL
jgi:hypothetical protein